MPFWFTQAVYDDMRFALRSDEDTAYEEKVAKEEEELAKKKEERAKKKEIVHKTLVELQKTLEEFDDELRNSPLYRDSLFVADCSVREGFTDRITEDKVFAEEIKEMGSKLLEVWGIKDLDVNMLVDKKRLPSWFNKEVYDNMMKAFKNDL